MTLQSILDRINLRKKNQAKLEFVQKIRTETETKLDNLIAQLDGEDKWFFENSLSDKKEQSCECKKQKNET